MQKVVRYENKDYEMYPKEKPTGLASFSAAVTKADLPVTPRTVLLLAPPTDDPEGT